MGKIIDIFYFENWAQVCPKKLYSSSVFPTARRKNMANTTKEVLLGERIPKRLSTVFFLFRMLCTDVLYRTCFSNWRVIEMADTKMFLSERQPGKSCELSSILRIMNWGVQNLIQLRIVVKR